MSNDSLRPMNLVVLGSGTSVPHAKRASPAFWLDTPGGTILVDAGPDTAHRTAEENLDWPNLDAVWISHFHLDHFGGLPALLFSLKWAPQTIGRSKPLRIYGPAGLQALLNAIDNANDYRLFAQRFPIELIEVDAAQPFEMVPGVEATAFSTPHTEESLALRLFERSGKSIVYSSDTGFAEELVAFAGAVDLLVLESSFRRNKPVSTHLEFSEAMQIATRSSPHALVLTHLYPEWDNHDLVAEASLLWSGRVYEATDGMRLTI